MKTWKEQLNELIAEANAAVLANDGGKIAQVNSRIALLSFRLVELYAQANTAYGAKITSFVSTPGLDGKKMSNADAVRAADASTGSLHDEIKMSLEAVDRIGMALKDQIKVWLAEKERPQTIQ